MVSNSPLVSEPSSRVILLRVLRAFDISLLSENAILDGVVNSFNISLFITLIQVGTLPEQVETNRANAIDFPDINSFISMLTLRKVSATTPTHILT